MLSRLNPKTGCRSLLKCIGQFQVPALSVATSPVHQNQSSQSDLIKPPRPQRLERNPETRFGFLPKSWFDFMYPKTGVTGPYMLMTSVGTYLLSKEIYVISPEFSLFMSGIFIITFIHNVYGDKIRKICEDNQVKEIEELDKCQQQTQNNIIQDIAQKTELKFNAEKIVKYLPEAKRENIYLQMEAAYRARMLEAYKKVKNQLDYHVEKQNIERRIAQRNMVDYVVRNVQTSISPQLKNIAIKQCISDLKTLSARA